jgi:2-iminobutanoate/2-iminopropanoate deaminase
MLLATDDETTQAQALENIRVVLEAAGSGFDKLLKMNIYLTNMDDYAAMNKACALRVPSLCRIPH